MRKKLYYTIHKKGMTQRGLAEKVGVSEPWMSSVVNGRRKPSLYLVMRISEELGISQEEVMENEEIF